MKTILLIDDDRATLEIINETLRPHYRTRIATLGARGLELARLGPAPDLILLDIELPDLDGYAVCAALKESPAGADIPVIFLSGRSDIGDITRGLELGAVDYVSKPVAPPILLARVRTQLRLREAQLHLADRNTHLEYLVSKRTRELEAKTLDLQRNQELAIVALGSVAETRDNETGNHIHRTRAYVEVLAGELAHRRVFHAELAARDWELIWKSAPLHDIGKVGIPDQVLLKPGPLNAAEFEIMKRHTTLGRDAIRSAEARMHEERSFLRVAMEIAYAHHERWDGKGYPEGLAGEAIPLAARLMAVADVYDALISRRVYKPPIPHAAAVEIIRSERGRQFDASVVDCFLGCAETCQEIASRFSDAHNEEGI